MAPRRPITRSAAGAILAILAMIVLAADQFVKHLTVEHLPLHEAVPVLGEFFQLYFVRNPGAAFSLGSEVTWIFTIALAVVAGGIVWKAFEIRSRLWATVLGCLLGGVLGNLADRLLREPGFGVGHVVDMISMPWMMPAIFNVADIFIVTGMISVALLVISGLRFDGTRERDHVAAEQAEKNAAAEAEAVDGAGSTGVADEDDAIAASQPQVEGESSADGTDTARAGS